MAFSIVDFFSSELESVKLERDGYHATLRESFKTNDILIQQNRQLRKDLEGKQIMSEGMPNISNGSKTFAIDRIRVYERRPDNTSDILVASENTYDAAMSFAKTAAARFPGNRYFITAYVAEVKADVPVVSTEIKFKEIQDNPKVDENKG